MKRFHKNGRVFSQESSRVSESTFGFTCLLVLFFLFGLLACLVFSVLGVGGCQAGLGCEAL